VSPGARRLLWAMIATGVVGRAVLGFETYGVGYDIDAVTAVERALEDDALQVYSAVNEGDLNRWPYPAGFFPFVVLAGALADVAGPFHGWIQVPQILADGAIAWLVQDFLGRRGASDRQRLAGAGLVALGPSFWIISGFHGQMDSIAILPAVAALWLWDRSPPGTRRALTAGLLVGVGAAMKSVPILMAVVLLASVRSRREAAALLLPAVAVPLLITAPWLVADTRDTLHSFTSHRALPGFGGIGLIAQPELADFWLNRDRSELSPLSDFLMDNAGPILAVLMAPLMALVLWRRAEPVLAAAILWPALVLLNPGFGFQYVVWALPFALMAGYLRQVAVLQAVLFAPAALLYWHPFGDNPTAVYVAIMIAAWFACVAMVGVLVARLARATCSPASASAPLSR
jgi:hypothetical protein